MTFPDADPLVLVAGLAVLGLVLFGLSCWRGRWSLWLGGYLAVLLAVAVAVAVALAARPAAASAAPEDEVAVAWNLRHTGGFTSVSREA